ncbi:putative small lipoprotein YifL [Mesocricetibacter intestinalis]|uniref:Putative small lipoprotein YifL n=1 Tax=Mesocricetibacter intestinalis TaxID=1521930 RepID=A0A4R6V6H5_9PAST|nr:lipoprotein [Mesocricetibacter intestinalis]TDQ56388.1 putative small lipoprotein YifL [Mesocricetibacter intestinalis]
MKKIFSLFLCAGFCFLLSACGVKGPLYFPQQDTTQQQTTASE